MTLAGKAPDFEAIGEEVFASHVNIPPEQPESAEDRRERLIRDRPIQLAKMERIAEYIRTLSAGFHRAEIPGVIDKQVSEIIRNSSLPPPPNVRKVAKNTLKTLAHNTEDKMYREEFPGHQPPEMPEYLLK